MSEKEIKLIALALYQIRIELGLAGNDQPHHVQFASRLAYALHNDALAIADGDSFDPEAALSRIAHIDQIIGGDHGQRVADSFRKILSETRNAD